LAIRNALKYGLGVEDIAVRTGESFVALADFFGRTPDLAPYQRIALRYARHPAHRRFTLKRTAA
jgi:hypothetical protein